MEDLDLVLSAPVPAVYFFSQTFVGFALATVVAPHGAFPFSSRLTKLDPPFALELGGLHYSEVMHLPGAVGHPHRDVSIYNRDTLATL